MLNESMIATANEAIARGEKTRILFEILLSHLDLGNKLESLEIKEIFDKMKEHQDAYNEAVKMLSLVMQEQHKRKRMATPSHKTDTEKE